MVKKFQEIEKLMLSVDALSLEENNPAHCSEEVQTPKTPSSPSLAPFFIRASRRPETDVCSSGSQTPVRSTKNQFVPRKGMGRRRLRRWNNDHHTGNIFNIDGLEDIIENMALEVTWRSNFEELMKNENNNLREEYVEGGKLADDQITNSAQNHYNRNDRWDDTEKQFMELEKGARKLLTRSFASFSEFMIAIEYVLAYFCEWEEAPSGVEIPSALKNLLDSPMTVTVDIHCDKVLSIPLTKHSFHRMIVHGMCRFFSLSSKSMDSQIMKGRSMFIKKPKNFTDFSECSLCEFINETRVPRPFELTYLPRHSKSSVSDSNSDGYQVIDLHDF